MYLTSEMLPRSVGALIGAVGEDSKGKTVKVGDQRELAGTAEVEAGSHIHTS